MYARQYEPLARQIEQEIERTIGLSVAVGEEQDGLHLVGLVDTEGNSEAAEDIARSMAPGREVINELEIQEVWPEAVSDLTAEDLRRFENADTSLAGQDVETDFADHSVSSDPISAPGPSSSGDDVVGEGDVAYFPPTDPVIQVEDDGDVEVLGGFTPSSTDDVGVDRSASDLQPGDEALADAIRRELREDASTTDLRIEVTVMNGVARLTGRVADLEDAENAEAVARGIPGVVDVEESLEVTEL